MAALVRDGVTGLFTDPQSAAAVLAQVDALLADPTRCRDSDGLLTITYVDALVQRAALHLEAGEREQAKKRLDEADALWGGADRDLLLVKQLHI